MKFMKFKAIPRFCWVTSSDERDHTVEENSGPTLVYWFGLKLNIGGVPGIILYVYFLCIFLPCRACASLVWGAQEGLCATEPSKKVDFSFPMLIFLPLF